MSTLRTCGRWNVDSKELMALRRNLPPHFNTPQVIANLEKVSTELRLVGTFKKPVRCRTIGKQPRHMLLHMTVSEKDVTYRISSPQGGWAQDVSREALMSAITGSEGEWAQVVLASHRVRLDRQELRLALQKLETKLRPRRTS